jgi:hypothetical protein
MPGDAVENDLPRLKKSSRCVQKLDRLTWTAGFAFTTHGLRLGVRANSRAALEDLRRHLPPRWRPSYRTRVDCLYSVIVGDGAPRGGMRRFHLLYADSTRLARTMEIAELVRAFESDVEIYVAAMAPERIFVHAGVVGWRGHAILIPGPSGSGKSRLVEALLRRGATYYSDEFAVLDSRGRVYPFRRPLHLRPHTDREERPDAVHVSTPRGMSPLPAGLILVTSYKRGGRWHPRLLSPGEATMALLAHTVPARLRPKQAVLALVRAARGATALRGPRGEAEDMAATVLREPYEHGIEARQGRRRRTG